MRLSKNKIRTLRQALGPICIIVPNFIKIGQKVAEMCDLTVFKMAAVRHLGLLKFNFFNGRSG